MWAYFEKKIVKSLHWLFQLKFYVCGFFLKYKFGLLYTLYNWFTILQYVILTELEVLYLNYFNI